MDKLKNKVAVITGSSGGIGLATAEEFIANGAKVVIFARMEITERQIRYLRLELTRFGFDYQA